MTVVKPEEIARPPAAVDRRSAFGHRDDSTSVVRVLPTGLRVAERVALSHFRVAAEGASRRARHRPAPAHAHATPATSTIR